MEGLRKGGLALIGATVVLVMVAAVAWSRVDPIDASIAKDKSGPYKSNGLHTDQLPDNPQVQSQKVAPGKSAKFYIRFKNKNAGSIGTYMFGDLPAHGFQITYTINGEDVTDDVTGDCSFREVPANGKLLMIMKVKAVDAPSGAKDNIGAGSANGSCSGTLSDLVWAKVKVD